MQVYDDSNLARSVAVYFVRSVTSWCSYPVVVRRRRSPSYNRRLQIGYEHQLVTVSKYTNKYRIEVPTLRQNTCLAHHYYHSRQERVVYMNIYDHITISSFLNEKCCRQNQNTHLIFSNGFFPKIVPFMRRGGKIWCSRAGHR